MLLPLLLAASLITAGTQKKTEFLVHISPRIGRAPQEALLRIITDDPTFSCPSVTVDWGDGSFSVQVGDCEADEPFEAFLWSRWHNYRSCNDEQPFTIRVTLAQTGKRRTETTTIILRCDADEPASYDARYV